MVYSAHDNSVYMGDARSKRILRLDLATETITTFMENLNQGVTSLAVEDNILYWVEEFSSNLLWVPTNTTSKVSSSGKYFCVSMADMVYLLLPASIKYFHWF